MSRVTGYKIVSSNSPVELGIDITEWCARGWEPIGGVSVSKENSQVVYHQALVKREGVLRDPTTPGTSS